MTRDNTIPIQPGQYGPDPIIQFYPRSATVPIDPAHLSIAPPVAIFVPTDSLRPAFMPPTPRSEQLPTGYSNVPPQPSMSQFPPQPAPMVCNLSPGMSAVGTGYERPKASEVPVGYDLIAA